MKTEALSIDGRVELAALRFNPGAPRRLLAFHGWLDNARSFAPLAEQLPDIEIVAVDFAGHGQSEHLPPGSWYHFVDYLDDVAAAIRHLDGRFDGLLGHSLGGAVSTAYAAARPEQIPRLLLIEALGPIASAPELAAKALRTGLDERDALAGKSMRRFAHPGEAVKARLAATPMAQASVECLLERGLRRADERWIWASDPRLTVASPLRLSEAAIQTWIAAIESPTLVIAAEQSPPYFPAGLRDTRFAQLRDGESVSLPGQHHLHMDTPEPVAAAIRDFLDRRAA